MRIMHLRFRSSTSKNNDVEKGEDFRHQEIDMSNGATLEIVEILISEAIPYFYQTIDDVSSYNYVNFQCPGP